ncbi:MAG: hypothetical protein AAGE96_15145 [Cyanobacteria bacterium P01_G01_bin.19]
MNGDFSSSLNISDGNLTEIAPPKIIKQLDRQLEQYSPQVEIISPQAEQVFDRTTIEIKLNVQDFPVFKDDKLELGNHLNLIIDNEPPKEIYNIEESIILKDLTPGTHTVRVFATRPWGESFKNEGAYAQTTFSILTETNENRPDRNLPLLTYNSPTGIYTAEPFLLDFYLTNAPLHSLAKSNSQLKDWKIKTTINGDIFYLENWQSVYLSGLNKGENWIQLEMVDEAGKNIENVFNNTVRVINYAPQQVDTLGRLLTDKIALSEAQSIVEQNYYIQPVGEPEIIKPEETPVEEPVVEEEKMSTVESAVENQDKTEDRIIPTTDQPVSESGTPIVVVETSAESESASIPEKVEEVRETIETVEIVQTVKEGESAELSPTQPTITSIKQDASDLEALPQTVILESELGKDKDSEIMVSILDSETDSASDKDKTDTEVPGWWKKLLVTLRHKLEGLAQSLPSEV